MTTINRWVRGRFLIVWISCLYVNRGAFRAFNVTGGEALSVMPYRPRALRRPPRVPRVAPPVPLPLPLRLSVPASEGELSAQASRPRAAGRRASSPEPGRPVSDPGRGWGGSETPRPQRQAAGAT